MFNTHTLPTRPPKFRSLHRLNTPSPWGGRGGRRVRADHSGDGGEVSTQPGPYHPPMPLGPLFRFELVRLARRGRHLPLRAALALALLAGLFVAYLGLHPNADRLALVFGGADTADRDRLQKFGEGFVRVFLVIQQAAVLLLTPVYCGGALTEEKERGRVDFLLTAPLTAWELVAGPLAARLLFVLGIVLTGLPVLAFTLLFGGVSGERVLAGFAVNAASAVSVGTFAVMLSVLRPTLRDVLFWAFGVLAASAVLAAGGQLCCSARELLLLSPVTTFVPLFDVWRKTPPADPTWAMVATFAGVHFGVAAGCVLVAVANVRRPAGIADSPVSVKPPPPPAPPDDPPMPEWYRQHVREAFPDDVPRPADGRGFVVPPLTDADDPLAWKEEHFAARLTGVEGRWFAWLRGCGLAFLLGLLALGLLVLVVIGLRGSGDGLRIGLNWLTRFFLAVGVCGVPMIGLRAAAGVSTERAKGTLEALFSLPIDRADILRAKWRAVVRRGSGWLYGMAALLGMATLLGAVRPLAAAGVAAVVAGFTLFCLGVGGWLSVRCASAVRAALWTLAVALGALLLPFALGVLFNRPLHLFSPPAAVWEVAETPLDHFDTMTREGPAWAGLVVGGVYAAAGWGLLALAARRFRREGV